MKVPETYIIDQQGVLREKVIGPRDPTILDNLQVITGLLKAGSKSAQAGSSGHMTGLQRPGARGERLQTAGYGLWGRLWTRG